MQLVLHCLARILGALPWFLIALYTGLAWLIGDDGDCGCFNNPAFPFPHTRFPDGFGVVGLILLAALPLALCLWHDRATHADRVSAVLRWICAPVFVLLGLVAFAFLFGMVFGAIWTDYIGWVARVACGLWVLAAAVCARLGFRRERWRSPYFWSGLLFALSVATIWGIFELAILLSSN